MLAVMGRPSVRPLSDLRQRSRFFSRWFGSTLRGPHLHHRHDRVLLASRATARAEVRVGPNYNLESDPGSFHAHDPVSLAVHPHRPVEGHHDDANYLDLVRGESPHRRRHDIEHRVPLLPPDQGAGEAPFDKRCNFHQSVAFGSGDNVYAIVGASRTSPALPDAGVIVYRSTDAA